MKKRYFAFVGAVALVAGSLLSCGSETDPNKYTDITKEEAQEIIANFDPETAIANVNTLVYEASAVENDLYMDGIYHADFREESLYLYYRLDSNGYSDIDMSMAYLITGSDDSYTLYQKMSTSSGASISQGSQIDYQTAKSNFDNLTSGIFDALVYNEEAIAEMETYGDVTYGSFSNYIKLQVTAEKEIDEENYYDINYYLIYTTDGLLRYGYLDLNETIDGETNIEKLTASVEYNTTISRRTSLD